MLQHLLKSISRPGEMSALIKLGLDRSMTKKEMVILDESALELDNIDFCFRVLDKVSRSFAAVIRQLPKELSTPVCIYYLVLRALDTIEDDMSLNLDRKLDLLRDFHNVHFDRSWRLEEVGDHLDYRFLLTNYYKVIHGFQELKPCYREVILDMCQKMGEGMAEFSERAVKSVEDYDKYCHYVAGLVGIGLSSLFSASNLEDPDLADWTEKSNSMGLFLQKTNIIRDLHEDFYADRVFWPTEIIETYVDALEDLLASPNDRETMYCLDHMVTNALQHASDSLDYMEKLKDPAVFRFCAIPQVMAIATLDAVFRNPEVFRGVVKIRKGQAAEILVNIRSIKDVYNAYSKYANSIYQRIDPNSPVAKHTIRTVSIILERCEMDKSIQRRTAAERSIALNNLKGSVN
jgi:farnesyl-diphosphate farnesyltransferase